MIKGLNNPSVRKRKSIQRNVIIFLVCFIISSLIWSLIKLSRHYDDEFGFKVSYRGFPKELLLANHPDSLLYINIESKGFHTLTKLIFSERQRLDVDLTNKLHAGKNNKNKFYLKTTEIIPQLNLQISPSKVNMIYPDTVWFEFDRAALKKIPVNPLLDVSFKKQFCLKGKIRVVPESVVVKGPHRFVDTMKSITSDKKSFHTLNAGVITKLQFSKYNKLFKITTSPESVKAFIPVEKFTESSIEVPVIVENFSKKMNIKTLPEKVTITYTVGLSDYKKVKPELFTVKAFYQEDNVQKMKVVITEQPEFVKVRMVKPERIEFILF